MNFQTKTTDLSTDALAVFEKLAGQHEQCFLLETLADTYQPQTTSQSYIGVAPDHYYSANGGDFYVDGNLETSTNPYDSLSKQITFNAALPDGYVGGLVGYFSHEGIVNFEASLDFPYPREFPDFEFGRYNDGLMFRPGVAPDYFYYDQDRSDLYRGNDTKKVQLSIEYIGSAKNDAAYSSMIDKASNDIQNGRVFQVVLANKYNYSFTGDLINLYKELRHINPSPFMFFIKFGNMVTMGASPEFLVTTKSSGKIYLEALAGTIHRGKTQEKDAELAAKLIADEKEVAEHSMLVDLARNDAGKISQTGSVSIDNLMFIKKFSHVQHISSVISGQLNKTRNIFDALAASFPAGTLSGAPKIEAIKMIKELEGNERGPYGGTIGYFGYNSDSMHAVNLRSISAVDNKLYLHSASGIVYDSTPERERTEISNKKAAMDQAMKPFLKKVEL